MVLVEVTKGDKAARATVTSHILKVPEEQIKKQDIVIAKMLTRINFTELTEDEIDLPDHKDYNRRIK